MKELLGRGTVKDAKSVEVSVLFLFARDDDVLQREMNKVRRMLEAEHLRGELIFVHNGAEASTIQIAQRAGALVKHIASDGYGDSVMKGVAAAQGKYVMAGVADGRYDFLELKKIYGKLKEGTNYVQGCRMPAGEGNIRPHAMSFSRRWILNPFFRFLIRNWSGIRIDDPGSRFFGISRDYFDELDMSCTGSEFNTELLVKSCLASGQVAEVPITLHQAQGEISHSDLNSFAHGLSALTVFLVAAPVWFLAGPGLILMLAGVAGIAGVSRGYSLNDQSLNLHFLTLSCCCVICGWQLILSSFNLRGLAVHRGIRQEGTVPEKITAMLVGRTGVSLGVVCILVGTVFMSVSLSGQQSFIGSDYRSALESFVLGVTMFVAGVQAITASLILKASLIPSRR